MIANDRRHLWSGFWATSLGTLASRVLGLVRDMATAALLGLGEGGVMDAFVVAFRVPNLLRRIFGEGALATSFLPVFTAELAARSAPRLAAHERAVHLAGDRPGWRDARRRGACRACCGGAARRAKPPPSCWSLSATLLPYMVFICLAAQASAALQVIARVSRAGACAVVAQRLLAGGRVVRCAAIWRRQAGAGLVDRRRGAHFGRFAVRRATAAARATRFSFRLRLEGEPRGLRASRPRDVADHVGHGRHAAQYARRQPDRLGAVGRGRARADDCLAGPRGRAIRCTVARRRRSITASGSISCPSACWEWRSPRSSIRWSAATLPAAMRPRLAADLTLGLRLVCVHRPARRRRHHARRPTADARALRAR